MKSPFFYAKILLFGEYGVIENARGLTLPFGSYKGMLNFKEDKASNNALKSYLDFAIQSLEDVLNVSRYQKDVEAGLSFSSDIPQGYGVGSSGALVAALYDKYSLSKINIGDDFDAKKVKKLKAIFSKMESYFHGKSSGIDPLICYLNIPLLIDSNSNIKKVGLPSDLDGNGAIFLLNSGKPSKTEPMVSIFFDKLKNQGFRKTLRLEFIKYNNACVMAFLNGDYSSLIYEIKYLSSWALEHFRPMIPKSVLSLWKKGIDENAFFLKLCGSGGGGYLLGFTADYKKAKPYLEGYDTELLMRI